MMGWTLVDVLLGAFVVGMSGAAVPPIVRALPFVVPWLERGVKPWACDLCMSFWSTILAGGLWAALGVPIVAALPAFVVTFFIVRRNSDPLHLPPMPELVDIENEFLQKKQEGFETAPPPGVVPARE